MEKRNPEIRAKFWCKNINHMGQGNPDADDCAEVTLAPVYDDDNGQWSKFTPQGEITMLITNPTAIERFALNQKYYVDFTPAD